MKKIGAFEIVDHGVDHAQYFQGCGVSHTEFTDVATGAADNARDAFEDAAEQLAQNDWDTSTLPSRPRGIRKSDRVRHSEHDGCEDCEIYYYVSIRVVEASPKVAPFTLRRERLNQGGYTDDGVYFGVGTPLYWYESADGTDGGFIRAIDRASAKHKVVMLHPSATFYR